MAISFDKGNKVFCLNTENTEYQIKINEYNMLLHTYYGAPVGNNDMGYLVREIDRGFSGNSYEGRHRRGVSPDTLPFEYSTDGAGDYRISAIDVVLENGSRTLDLRYKSHSIIEGKEALMGLPHVRGEEDKVSTLKISLFDEPSGIEVTLIYSVFEKKDIITRSAKITNTSGSVHRLTKAASMGIDMLNKKMDMIHFHGRHAMERQPERIPLTHDVHVVSSKRGASSHHNNPFVILCDRDTTENSGECYGFMLVYSGNHAEEIEVDQAGSIRLVCGIGSNNFDWRLGSGESFDTPEVIMAYTGNGLNDLSFLYHRIIRENVCPREFRQVKRPVLINNWEGTYFNFDEKSIIEIADAAADAGCEMLVLDDGWFGERNDDNRGLGDWFVNEKKLPGSLSKIADHVNSLGMKFGLWFEPEMVNEDSELFRNHPDWALRDPDRNPVMGRNQLVLDMSRREVVDYLFDSMSKILDSANISYIKWDFNRSMANVFSNAMPADRQGEVPHRFVLGTYDLLGRLRKAYPEVMMEGCAGGGGRFDAGILFYSPQIWCSDNSEAINRLKIQKGTSYGYPVSTMGSHVSASPNHQNGRKTPLTTRAIVAMSGTFGYEFDPRKFSKEERAEMRCQIALFNKYYELIQRGRYYRLSDKLTEDYFTAWEFVAADKSEVLLNLVVTDVRGNPEIPFVKLPGLDPDAVYEIDHMLKSVEGSPEEAGIEERSEQGMRYTGRALMNGGLALDPLYGVYPAVQIHFNKI
ncbi:alpha-galactosidase [Butyrivibrio sp. ob235]|uniref:alpha-galactosidase n=1 Tax=Butyrivibrio sp. ob235 TaxID=1761780 RepID=UPI0008B65AB5|nr:alpha-galactosidase [Butyrivibrio sp. ob235]SEL93979.1 alpha-galactosidase [Butyrivibrio sp. ob235]